MTDIMDSQAVKAAAAASAANAAQPSAHQPLRTAVVKAAELARAAEERARDKQHAKGKKTARERLDLLFDTGTFEEIGRFQGGNIAGSNAGAAVITGFGQVYGRKVAVYAQDFSVKGGTLGTAEGEKICRLMDMAIDLKVPIVAIVDSGGARIQEGRGRPDPVRSHLPQDLRGQRLRAPAEPDSRPLRRRCRLLPGPDGPHHHDP